MKNVSKGEANFIHNSTNIHEELSKNDIDTIKEIFDGKKLYNDNPSCGFSEDVSLVLDNTESFYMACDTCPIIYYKNEDKYFKLSDDEIKNLSRY